MNHILSIARRELRAYFLSPVALIFLGTFLLATLFAFFWVDSFFTRNLADVRPLFSWLPVLLIFLVAALTMRQWSEEQKLGTIEILLTLPVPTHHLVVGKFLGGLGLVGVALGLTLGIPLTVSMMGDLDWGPVIGGYVGALLLAGAYLSIGLFISALTENQIVALIGTALGCALLYAIGSDPVTDLFGNRGAELLRSLGTGSRFESIRRGVLDLRDVLYYGSLITFFLVLNNLAVEAKRWSDGSRTRSKRTNLKVGAVLVLANLAALTLWMASVPYFRIDMTERGEYSISKVTKNLVGSLDSPLLIRGYFSEKTHPLLAPLVPRIRDLIQEYRVISPNVRAEFVDPQKSEDLEKEANQAYGIKSFPFRVASRYEDAVVNSYFSVLIKYGDQYEVLNFDELIEVKAGANDVEVKLRNLEYDLTRSIKKVAFGFKTLDAVFADVKDEIEFTAYVSTKTLPENFKDVPGNVESVLKEMADSSGGKFKYAIIDPAEAGIEEELLNKYGFRPMATSMMATETFYLHLLLRVGERYERIMPAGGMSKADIQKEVVAAVKRSTPGFLKTIGLVKPKLEAPKPDPRFPQMPPQQPQDQTRMISQTLEENYGVKPVTLDSGRVPGDIDVLMLLGPRDLTETQKFAIDQYLMRGGTVIAFTGKFELNPNPGPTSQGIEIQAVSSGLDELLSTYGVTLKNSLVLDPQNEAFPIPVVRDLGGLRVRDIKLLPYPFFVDVRRDGMGSDNPVVGGLPSVTMHWASPLQVKEAEEGLEVEELLKSTAGAWTQTDTKVQPDFDTYPDKGFGPTGETGRHVLAVTLKGKFSSAFAEKPSPIFGEAGQEGDRTGQTIKESPANTRLAVVGSQSFFNDVVLGLSRQTGGDRFTNNLQFIENLIDWSLADVELLTIRSRGTFARTLVRMEASERKMWEYVNYGLVALALAVLIAVSWGRRRNIRPIDVGGASKSEDDRSQEVQS